jgi:hypothetical protein
MSRGMPLFLLVSNVTHVTFILCLRCLLNFLVSVIPLLLDDTCRIMESWGASGIFDPFDNVYEVSTFAQLFLLPY